jgi:hypothetical protein
MHFVTLDVGEGKHCPSWGKGASLCYSSDMSRAMHSTLTLTIAIASVHPYLKGFE